MVDKLILKVDHNTTYVQGKMDSHVYDQFKKELGYKPENAYWMIKNNAEKEGNKEEWKKDWDGTISSVCWNAKFCHCHTKKKGLHFHTGLLTKAVDFLRANNVQFQRIDCRTLTPKTNRYTMSPEFESRDYQLEVINKVVGVDGCKGIDRGIIKAATGSGKTSIACGIISGIGVSPTIFYVPSIDLLKQAKDEIERFVWEDGSPVKVGIVGGGKKDIRDITVMTIQTAVRALGGVWVKYDEEDVNKDDTDISDIKGDIKNLIHNCRLMIGDECQHWSSETCQIISDSSVFCQYRYLLSATPFRDKGDDILIEACAGKTIADISASFLIKRGYLMKPTIYFSKINNMRGMRKTSYADIYKQAIVENEARNAQIVTIARKFYESGRKVLILVKQISHGKLLEKLISDSIFMHGSTGKKKREKHLDIMRKGLPQITIASSLPYEELLLVKQDGMIRQIAIGDLCNNYSQDVKNGNIETVCSKDGKNVSWSKITDTHIHDRENRLVYVRTNKNEDIYVTENHSLVNSSLQQILPKKNDDACVPVGGLKQEKQIASLDVINLLKDIDDESIEVMTEHISQGEIRSLKKHLMFLEDQYSVGKSSRIKYKKIKLENKEEYILALRLLLDNFSYYKRKRRAKLKDVSKIDYLLLNKYFKLRIFIRRSRKNISIPLIINITNDLALISGLLCGDGHIRHHKGKSIFVNCFAGLGDMEKSAEGKNDVNKRNIRDIFKKAFKKVFSIKLQENDKHILFNGKLMYYFFSQLGVVDKNGIKKVPDYIFNSERKVQESFLYGLYLSDGAKKFHNKIYKKKNKYHAIVITNTSRPLVSGVISLLKIMNLEYYLYSNLHSKKEGDHNYWKDSYNICIINDFHNMKVSRCNIKKKYSCDRFQKDVIYLNREDKKVYDISVDGCHNFVAGVGNILAHNTIFDEGIDCKPLDTLLLAGGGKSPTRALQRIGRILRPYPGKKDAIAVDFLDNCKYMQAHSAKRASIYETEEEFNIEVFEVTT